MMTRAAGSWNVAPTPASWFPGASDTTNVCSAASKREAATTDDKAPARVAHGELGDVPQLSPSVAVAEEASTCTASVAASDTGRLTNKHTSHTARMVGVHHVLMTTLQSSSTRNMSSTHDESLTIGAELTTGHHPRCQKSRPVTSPGLRIFRITPRRVFMSTCELLFAVCELVAMGRLVSPM